MKVTETPASNATDSNPAINLKKLKALRRSPAMQLIANSPLLLKAYQLDLDCPPKLDEYVREQLIRLLRRRTAKPLEPDKLFIRFTQADQPAVEPDGRERYAKKISLTDLAIISFDVPAMLALMDSTQDDTVLDESVPDLTANSVMDLILNAPLATDYAALTNAFWVRHAQTYCALAKLAFLHDLHTHYAHRRISLDGYRLGLDILGLKAFPEHCECLEHLATGTRSSASMLSLNGRRVAGAFQLKSHNTSHCFIHQPGSTAEPTEYISDDPHRMTHMLLNTLNESGGLHVPDSADDGSALKVDLSILEGDVFTAITRVQQQLSLGYLQGDSVSIDWLKPIRPALQLISAIDLWHTRPTILQRIPSPLKTAARLMRKVMKDEHGLDINPDHVFIRYIRGKSFTPLGSARVPTTQVTVPDGLPISLSQALIYNYRVEHAEGYLDHDARTIVYIDPTEKGHAANVQELAITPQAIENHIRKIDFLPLMTRRVERFWGRQQDSVEECFKTNFMTQAVLCLKSRLLSKSGFDIVIKTLEQLDVRPGSGAIERTVLGFYLQHSVFEGVQEIYCPGLLILSEPGRPQKVLYQAGVHKALIEFDNEEDIDRYLRSAVKNQQWRKSALNYVPLRHHRRLTYILQIWSGEREPEEPASTLRPWTDTVFNLDAHMAAAHKLCTQQLTVSPFRYMAETLKQNGLMDAQDVIVTPNEVLLKYWTRQLNHLQLLLAPMSFLLTPALIAALATEIGVVSLNIAAANLPGARYEEKRQAQLAVLSLGFLQLAPYTPTLLRSLGKLVSSSKVLKTSATAIGKTRGFSSQLNRSMHTRHTRLEKFFETDSLLKTWNIPGHPRFATVPVKTWKLTHKFLLWTSDRGKARTLVVSTHGYYLPWSKNTLIPNGTELRVYAPHGYTLIDPSLHRVIQQRVKPFGILDNQANTLVAAPNTPLPYALTDKLLAGTSQPGKIKNYKLSKFQSPDNESYRYISHVVRDSNLSPFSGQLLRTPMDVLTVRKRFGMADPTLEDLFKGLFDHGIHYDKILLLHCRCSAFESMIGTAHVYRVP
ncbi:dermonecrotic toxin domain-containing protein [Pseudomonas sp. DSP3-2-2]|uniref:dermonecrotic toxin domain-containing protein n=2 Tax=unclassified Pseudomonas TaxID=196821 RepID=UPI003CF7A7A7